MIVKAMLLAFGDCETREIDVPDGEVRGYASHDLELVFRYGQNLFQPRRQPSLSVGDAVELYGKYWLVKSAGWKELSGKELEAWKAVPRRDRSLVWY